MKSIWRTVLINTLLVVISIAAGLAFLEAGLRAKLALDSYLGRDLFLFQFDSDYGWKATPNFRWIGTKLDFTGEQYHAHVTTDDNGYRFFGDITGERPRWFVIGDSYTHAIDVSDDKTYFALLANWLPIEVFAYGCGGWATLQQYMLIDERLETIKPDFILWQLCRNDILNNTYELERLCDYSNNRMRRPYLTEEGGIEYRTPSPWPRLRHLVNQYSRLGYIFWMRLDFAGFDPEQSAEHEIDRQGMDHPALRRAVDITDRIFAMTRERCGETPIYAFNVDAIQPYHGIYRELCQRYGIHYIDAVPAALIQAERDEIPIFALDGAHWNERGHRVVAEALAQSLPLSID